MYMLCKILSDDKNWFWVKGLISDCLLMVGAAIIITVSIILIRKILKSEEA